MHQREEHHRLLVEQVADYAIFVLDLEGRILTWNVGAERLKGYRADEVIGKHFSIFYPEEKLTQGQAEEELRRARHDGHVRGRRLARPQGRHALLGERRDHRAPRRRGQLIGFGKVTRDLTAADASRGSAAARARSGSVCWSSSVKDYAIFMLDPHGIRRDWNAGAERIKGYTARARSSASTSRSSTRQRTRRRASPSASSQVATREGRFEDEGWRVRKDGTRFWANVVITALRDDDAAGFVGFAKVTRDLTEREAPRRNASAERGAVPPARRAGAGLRDLHARSRRARS